MEQPTNPKPASPGVGKSSSSSKRAGKSSSSSSRRKPVTSDEDSTSDGRSLPRGFNSFDSPPLEEPRLRRSSAFSEFQDEVIDPGPDLQREGHQTPAWRSNLPLMFAILPPTVGLVFKNGSSFFTDVLLLGLAAIFLRWSIITPWKWYGAAQQLREEQEMALEEDMGIKSGSSSPKPSSSEDVGQLDPHAIERTRKTEAALSRLRTHELTALAMCFLAPAASAYLLHYVRELLSRPSESLVSNFNLTIFLLSAEIAPFSHAIKLVIEHTLHLQRIVHSNPYRVMKVTPEAFERWHDRLNAVDAQLRYLQDHQLDGSDLPNMEQLQANVFRDVHDAMKPKIDSINRTIRRNEKQAREFDRRLQRIDNRIDDVISFMEANGVNAGQLGMLGRMVNTSVYVATLPMRMTFAAPIRAARTISWLLGRRSKDARTRTTTRALVVRSPGRG